MKKSPIVVSIDSFSVKQFQDISVLASEYPNEPLVFVVGMPPEDRQCLESLISKRKNKEQFIEGVKSLGLKYKKKLEPVFPENTDSVSGAFRLIDKYVSKMIDARGLKRFNDAKNVILPAFSKMLTAILTQYLESEIENETLPNVLGIDYLPAKHTVLIEIHNAERKPLYLIDQIATVVQEFYKEKFVHSTRNIILTEGIFATLDPEGTQLVVFGKNHSDVVAGLIAVSLRGQQVIFLKEKCSDPSGHKCIDQRATDLLKESDINFFLRNFLVSKEEKEATVISLE